ncbi:large conductance mechanosensitive channel protein MscL [Paenibacillus sp. SYP-B4298]|uniref:large conductance mechanosensitive channel protein MscL n=1 Tax=Paenibacillus sp. SYP-B4298 TaxID=2996034 RepID=UPI0022DD5AD2|nr:large conductance mechanosensitive channel protein MscL [Paenibacillus sp. SYP-B4298]
MSMSKLLKEFKEFAVRGNVIDLAVGVIIGGAFGKIVTSLVNDIIMPPIGMLLGNVNFTDLYFSLEPERTMVDGKHISLAQATDAGVAVIAYGQFINIMLNFIIVAFCIFLMVKGINSLHRKKEAPAKAEPTTKECPFCLSTIPVKATRCGHCTSQLVQEEAR